MIVTEKEAATMWCPHARTIGFHPMGALVTGNRTTAASDPTVDQQTRDAPPACRCIGPRCMSWRWAMSELDAVGTQHGRRGFCGLAGKP